MPTKKNAGRWPIVLADYIEAIRGNIDPVNKEIFMNYSDKDLMFYDELNDSYVSFVDMVRSGMVNIWKDPCLTYDDMVSKYPNPDLMTTVPVIDSNIIYMYIGKGKWEPISINALKTANSTRNGLLAKTDYDKIMENWRSAKWLFYHQSDKVPIPFHREQNTIYAICTGISAGPYNVLYWDFDQNYDPIDQKDPTKKYTRLFAINSDGTIDSEIKDPGFIVTYIQDNIVPVEDENLSSIYYLLNNESMEFIFENLEDNIIIPNDNVKYDRIISTEDGTNQVMDIIYPGMVYTSDTIKPGDITDEDCSVIIYLDEDKN